MNLPLTVLHAIAIVLGTYVFYLLAFVRRSTNAFKVIAFYAFGLILASSFWFLFHSGMLDYFPHLYKVAAPFALLLMPCVYISIRMILNNEKNFLFYDLMLFIPGLFYYIQLIPVYLLPYDVKLALIQDLYEDPTLFWFSTADGHASGKYYHLFGLFYNFILLFATQRVIVRFNVNSSKEKRSENQIVIRFAKGIFIVYLVTYIIYGAAILLLNSFPSVTFYLMMIVILLPLLYLVVYLLAHPVVLYGMNELLQPKATTLQESPVVIHSDSVLKIKGSVKPSSNIKDVERIHSIESYLLTTQVFLQPSFTMDMLSDGLNMTKKSIRQSIESVYGLSFPSFINYLRLQYFIEQLNLNPHWRKYSIQKISAKLGYLSAASFYSSFKNIYQCTPKAFIKQFNS